jgi:hypothetical protein
MRRMALLAAMCIAPCAVMHSQSIDGGRAGVSRAATADSSDMRAGVAERLVLRVSHLTTDQRRAIAPVASALVPGAGQGLLHQSRGLAYFAVEAVAWWRYATNVRERSQQEGVYKDVANRVARAQFSAAPRDSDWTFYEMMRDYVESGHYSLSPSGPVVPETDPTTFNGSRWLLAQSTNPTMADALAEYERTAVKPEFRWSWRNAQFQYDIFKRGTAKRNDANVSANTDLLVIGANHVLSMVDAFATMRLQVRAEADGRTSIGASVRW